ncbi:MAG: hemolysin family protein [Taibaiella sp.]|nr:hemolysin family protein [Taibaiella sp.]
MDADPLSAMMLLEASPSPDISVYKILLTLFLVLLNGFFVAAEFAIVKVRMSQVEVQKGINQGLAKAAKSILGQLDGYLAATQLGITLASLGLGWIGESVMEAIIINTLGSWISPETAHAISLPVGFAIITVLHIVFGELAPKSLAIRYPTNTTFFVAWPLKLFYIIMKPFIFILNGFANIILRIFGIKPIHGSEIHSEEELRMIITESHEGGAIEETERELIQNVFDFDDRRVLNIYTMRKNISAIDISISVKEALDFAIKEGYSRYPVYEEDLDNIKGLLYTKDLMKTLMVSKSDQQSIQPLLRKAYYISENSKIKNVLKDFQSKHIQMALVTNEIGEFTGIVTMEDILEELVGEIQDEYDNEKPIVEQIDSQTFVVSAHSNLTDINKYIPHRLEEGEHYDTLSGLIADKVEDKELREGEIIGLNGYEGRILKMYRNSVETIELKVKNEEGID